MIQILYFKDEVIYQPMGTIGPTWSKILEFNMFCSNKFFASKEIANLFVTIFIKKNTVSWGKLFQTEDMV